MRARSLLLVLLVVVLMAFVILNWFEIARPTRLSLGYGAIEGPLGLILLGFLVLFAAMFLAFVVYAQTSAYIDARRYAKEIQATHELADKAEASRFTELRTYLEEALQQQQAKVEAVQDAIIARLDAVDQSSRTLIEQSGNSVAASIGELEDRLERARLAPPEDYHEEGEGEK